MCFMSRSGRPDGRLHRQGFTILEMLVSAALFSFLLVILAGMLNSAGGIWQRGLAYSQRAQTVKNSMDFIGGELSMAMLPLDRSSQNSLRFEIDPVEASTLGLNNAQSIFWQVPIASEETFGRIATVGYFVKWQGARPALYRFFLNPSDPRYNAADPNAAIASVTDWEEFQFLENVAGMWINAYDRSGNALSLPYDSRVSERLPAMVGVSLVVIDAKSIERLKSQPGAAGGPQEFINGLPAEVRPGALIVRLKINLGNASQW